MSLCMEQKQVDTFEALDVHTKHNHNSIYHRTIMNKITYEIGKNPN